MHDLQRRGVTMTQGNEISMHVLRSGLSCNRSSFHRTALRICSLNLQVGGRCLGGFLKAILSRARLSPYGCCKSETMQLNVMYLQLASFSSRQTDIKLQSASPVKHVGQLLSYAGKRARISGSLQDGLFTQLKQARHKLKFSYAY